MKNATGCFHIVKYNIWQLWMSDLAHKHPDFKFATACHNDYQTSALNFMPPAIRFIPEKIIIPRILPLFGMAHKLEDGALRLIDALDERQFQTGIFCASAKNALTGPVVDQASIFPDFANEEIQDNANAAIHQFC
jgi:hypothetical protein